MRAVVEGFDVLGNRTTHAHIENMNTYTITKQQYCYLLPTYGLAAGRGKIRNRYDSRYGTDTYVFIGTHAEYLEALSMCIYLDHNDPDWVNRG